MTRHHLHTVIPTEASRSRGSRSGGIVGQGCEAVEPLGPMRRAIPPLRGAKARRFGRDDGVVRAETVVRLVALALAILLLALPAHAAITPDEILADPALEERARGITKQLRCLVCQNQSIDDSSAPLARDLRLLVRERLKAGDSDAATLNFVVARYGDFVLLRPPVKATTWLLWFGPALLLLAGVAFLWMRTRQRRVGPAPPAPLDAAEEKKLAELMDAPGKGTAP